MHPNKFGKRNLQHAFFVALSHPTVNSQQHYCNNWPFMKHKVLVIFLYKFLSIVIAPASLLHYYFINLIFSPFFFLQLKIILHSRIHSFPSFPRVIVFLSLNHHTLHYFHISVCYYIVHSHLNVIVCGQKKRNFLHSEIAGKTTYFLLFYRKTERERDRLREREKNWSSKLPQFITVYRIKQNYIKI